MYGFLKVVMYVGVAASLAGYFYRIDDAQLGLALPMPANQLLSFGGLALIIIGFAGRQLTKPEDTVEWKR